MILTKPSFRNASARELGLALRNAHDYTLTLFDCFAAAGMDDVAGLEKNALFSPPLWTLGHLAWFAEWFVLREAESSHPAAAVKTSILTKGDDWFDPATVGQSLRWSQGLPKPGQLKTYFNEVFDRVQDKLSREANDDAALYPYRLALAYQDMQGEHWVGMLQALGLHAPVALERHATPSWAQGEIRFPGGTLQMGSNTDEGFVFDNEKWAHAVYVPAFVMDSNLISNAQFAEFVGDNGYQRPQYWSNAGRQWLMEQERSAPQGWLRDGHWWRCERFGRHLSLIANEPVRTSACMKRRPIANGRIAACRLNQNGNLPPIPATLHSAGAICGNGHARPLSLIRGFHPMLLPVIPNQLFPATKVCAAHLLLRPPACAR